MIARATFNAPCQAEVDNALQVNNSDLASSDPINVLRGLYRILPVLSIDRSTKVGAALCCLDGTRSIGVNRFLIPRFAVDPESYIRPLKYDRTIHAEVSSITSAASYGSPTAGATMIATWAACKQCAKTIIGARVARVIVHKEMFDLAASIGHWEDEVDGGIGILRACGVKVEFLSGAIGEKILLDGRTWDI